MYYAACVYIREGPLAKVWVASHTIRKLSDKEVRDVEIVLSVDAIQSGKHGPLALRLSGQLLLGITRIYKLKVDAADEQATHALNLVLKANGPNEKAPAKRRKVRNADGGDDEEDEEKQPLEARPESLRGKAHAITAARMEVLDDLDLSSSLDLQAMMDRPGLEGMELEEAMRGMGDREPDFTIDAASLPDMQMGTGSGLFQLTQNKSSSASVADNHSVYDGEDGRVSPAPADENEVDFDAQLNMSVAGGRAADLASDNGLGLDSSSASILNKSAQHIGKLGFEDDLDLGGADAGYGGDEIPEHAAEAPAAAAARRSGAAHDDLDAEMDAAKADVLSKQMAMAASAKNAKKQSLKERASRKRGHGTFTPQVDEITELPGHIIKGWLHNPEGTLHPKSARPSVLNQRTSLLQRKTQEAQAFMQTKEHVQPWCTPMSMAGASLGPALAASMRASYTMALRLPGLPYRLVASQAAEPAVPGTPLSNGGLAGVEDPELDFGANGDDAFAFGADATEMPQEGEIDGAVDGVEAAEMPDDGNVSHEHEPPPDFAIQDDHQSFLDASAVRVDEDDLSRQKRLDDQADADCRQFFNEHLGSKHAAAESIESGWSRRTVAFHNRLTGEFNALPAGAAKQLDLLSMVSKRSKATAAAALYQTLVLASSGFVTATQAGPFDDIVIRKTATFNKKKPKVPTQSSAEDTDMSPEI